MGLDVYLYRYEDKAAYDTREQRYEKALAKVSASFPGKYSEWSDEQKAEYGKQSDELAKKFNMPVYRYGPDGKTTYPDDGRKIEFDSTKYPEHLFKVGYLRSSYNDSGVNHVLRALIGVDLHYIFEPNDDSSDYLPEWEKCKERLAEVIRLFNEARNNKPYRVSRMDTTEYSNGSPIIDDDKKALDLFLEEKERSHVTGCKAYSNARGEFYLGDPLPVAGIVRGRSYHSPCVYIITKDSDSFDWYSQALEITMEMIDYVLSQPDRDKYWLTWSS